MPISLGFSSVTCTGSDMICAQRWFLWPWFTLKIPINPPFPSGVKDGACTPHGHEAP